MFRPEFNNSPVWEDTPDDMATANSDKPTRTPLSTEPDFEDPSGACHVVYWQDCIAQLAVDVREKQSTASPCDFEFLKPQIVEYVFTVCVRLRLPSEVRFTAALILNTYLLRQLCSLHEFVEKKSLSSQLKQKEWENLETNMERQLPLRILTAIQISSKFHSYHDSISARQVVNTLRKIGYPYTISAVELSEQRVFKLIGFKIPDSPLEACEMTMKVLTYTLKKKKVIEVHKYEDLWQHTLIVLDICFINHKEIYDNFFQKCRSSAGIQSDKRLLTARLKWDVLLLAAATVQTAAFVCLGEAHNDVISEVINRLLRCDPYMVKPLKEAILEFATSRTVGDFSECDN